MKRLAIMNEKGGVGKSFLACQFAFYAAQKLKKRVLVIDLDQQCNTSKCLSASPFCITSSVSASEIFRDAKSITERADFVVVKGDEDLTDFEADGRDKHPAYVKNLVKVIDELEGHFDLVILDTNPNPDMRAVAALYVASHVVSPVQLKQESIDGVGKLYNMVQAVKEDSPDLDFIGLVINLAENKPSQQRNLKALMGFAGSIVLRNYLDRLAIIPNRIAYSDAQQNGCPVWGLPKSAGTDAWRALKPTFMAIADKMNLIDDEQKE